MMAPKMPNEIEMVMPISQRRCSALRAGAASSPFVLISDTRRPHAARASTGVPRPTQAAEVTAVCPVDQRLIGGPYYFFATEELCRSADVTAAGPDFGVEAWRRVTNICLS
jgi:hypothetical protein